FAYLGPRAVVFDRVRMLAGQPATMQYVQLSPPDYSLLPADLDGATPPPAGAPNTLAVLDTDALKLFHFHVDWSNPLSSTFSGPTVLPTAPFNWLCPTTADCIRQPGTTVGLDGLGFLMNRLAYRNFGDHEALVVNHPVDLGSGTPQAGLRWYEIRDPAGAPVIAQQGTYAPDSDSRWVGSAALDQAGNLAVGYSVSSSSTYPSIRYAGRLATDPPGVLAQGERTLIAGAGSQTRGDNRWGDYAMLTVDPVDDCTFWFTSEYMPTTGDLSWQTRIGSFRFPSCGPPTPTPTRTATASPTVSPSVTRTASPTRTAVPTATQTTNPTATPTAIPTATRTAPPAATSTAVPTATRTHSPTATLTVLPSATATWTALPSATRTPSPLATLPPTPPSTATPLATHTPPPPPTSTAAVTQPPSSTPTQAPLSTATPPPTATTVPTLAPTHTTTPAATATATPCPMRFTDVQPGDYFYEPVRWLTCRGVISGYADVTFRPYNQTTRSQQVKIVVLGFAMPLATPGPAFTFADVAPGHPFFAVIETAAAANLISGYACGGPGEPCDAQQRPYFRPYNNVTRGQLAKIIVAAAGWPGRSPASGTFADVAPGSAFYPFVEAAVCHGILSGYTCGGPGEPCDAENRPYYRPGNPATRGQIAKIVYNAVTAGQPCGP
ncbi:MAG TPA: S-layer homology domain-containing protein, partial [Chloroflexia bacterium]|nr:S-layer homology domain-containing protein [Chloroflexia bacterium]